jgi:hypothetical protein
LDSNIDKMNLSERDFVNEHRPESVKENLKGAEEGFSSERIEEDSLQSRRKVGIETINAKGLMVC